MEFLLQLARQRRTSCTPPPLPRLAESCRLVAFGWRPVLVPELLRDERRVGCGKFAYELRFIVDALVQGAAKACSETTAPGAHLERSAIDA